MSWIATGALNIIFTECVGGRGVHLDLQAASAYASGAHQCAVHLVRIALHQGTVLTSANARRRVAPALALYALHGLGVSWV